MPVEHLEGYIAFISLSTLRKTSTQTSPAGCFMDASFQASSNISSEIFTPTFLKISAICEEEDESMLKTYFTKTRSCYNCVCMFCLLLLFYFHLTALKPHCSIGRLIVTNLEKELNEYETGWSWKSPINFS